MQTPIDQTGTFKSSPFKKMLLVNQDDLQHYAEKYIYVSEKEIHTA